MLLHSVLLFAICNAVESAEKIQVNLQMREETPPYTRIGSIGPSLPASLGSKLNFITESPFFSVNPTSGEVLVHRIVDRERVCPDYKFCCGALICQLKASVYITDKNTGEFAASVDLKVDLQDQNDNRPSFADSHQIVRISEAATLGSFVSLTPATDADVEPANQIQRYTLIEPTGTFGLDLNQLPSVRLQLNRPVDREVKAAYSATLEACDPGACARQTVEIQIEDVNDNMPIFQTTMISKHLMEDLRVGDIVLELNATDADSGKRGQVIYSILGNVDSDLLNTFELVEKTGVIRLKRPLAAHTRDNYRFKVGACDAVTPNCIGDENSTVEISISVVDINNFAPTIHAVAAGGSITSPNTESESTETDSGLYILENTTPSQVAVITVRDEDIGENAEVACNLNDTHAINSPDFILSQSAPGIYSLRTARKFDYEIQPVVNTKIVCYDHGRPQSLTSARVITVRVVDVNEYRPEFSRRVYVGRVPENAPTGMEVLTTTATDRDRGAVLRYQLAMPPLQSGNWESPVIHEAVNNPVINGGEISADLKFDRLGVNKYFVVDEDTGILRTSQVTLDRETVSSVTLVVLVTDSKLSPVYTATTTISIEVMDENDNAPLFINPPVSLGGQFDKQTNGKEGEVIFARPFNVVENAPRYTKLSEKLEARDPDQGDNGRVHFSLLETRAFVRTPLEAGHYSNPSNLLHQLESNELVIDLINNLDLTQKLVEEPIFRISPDGSIETLVELDRETVPTYLLKISAQDRGAQPLASTTTLRVDVLDANDNSPTWLFPTPVDRTINLTTAMRPGSLAGRLRAEDSDTDKAGKVEFLFLGPRGEPLKSVSIREGLLDSLSSENDAKSSRPNDEKIVPKLPDGLDMNGYRVGPLYLNGSTGEIWVAQLLTPGAINLHLRAHDGGVPRMQTDAWLTINVFLDPSEDPGFFNFGGDGTLNVTIILVMIAITAIVSLLLIVGIVCVRRRPVSHSPGANGSALADGPHSPTHYGLDPHKDIAGSGLIGCSWSGTPIYGTGPYYHPHGAASPFPEDGQMFATLGGSGVMGYGAMVAAQSDTGSMIYVPQPPPPPPMPASSVYFSNGTIPGSMTPMPMEHGVVPVEYTGRNTFGTLTRNRGSFSGVGGYCTNSTNCGLAYEPHLDADSGDSGRGPSEEGNQLLMSDNHRNGFVVPGSISGPYHHPYNTYTGFRSSSRPTNYFAPDNGMNGMINLHCLSCPLVGGKDEICACHLLQDPNQTPQSNFEPVEYHSMNYPPSAFMADSHPIPLPPVQSVNQTNTDDRFAQQSDPSSPDRVHPANHCDGVVPLKLDLRHSADNNIAACDPEQTKPISRLGAPVLPPLAIRKVPPTSSSDETNMDFATVT